MKNFIVMKNGTEHATLNAKSREEAVKKVIAYYGEELQVEEDEETQLELLQEIVEKAGINIVTCGNCGNVILHRTPTEEIKCESCEFESEPCDFPDLIY